MASFVDGAGIPSASRDFTVSYQKVELEIDLATQSLKGSTEITVVPQSKELRVLRFNCRQSRITFLQVEGRPATLKYQDPYNRVRPHPSSNAHQHHLLRAKLDPQLKTPPEEELHIVLPKSIQIQDIGIFSADIVAKSAKANGETSLLVDTPATATASEQAAQFAPIKVTLEFEIKEVRDGLRFVGLGDGDTRYPHVYTRNSPFPGRACCLFPCVDDPLSRCTWEIHIKCPRTLGDAFRIKKPSGKLLGNETSHDQVIKPGHVHETEALISIDGESDDGIGLSERERALDLSVICSGKMTDDEIVDPQDDTKKIVKFDLTAPVSANQIGFAIGPFEAVELSDFREIDDDEKLGTQAIRVHGFCLPGRADEVRNTCMPLAKAVDFFTTTYTAYSGSSYKLCFVDDLTTDTAVTAAFTLCSTRLLFPVDIIAPLTTVTRQLVLALAEQYAGISLVAREPSDAWVIAGMASFMTDVFMKQLSGNNEYRFQQKQAADRVYELDMERPSLYNLGSLLHLDRSEAEFLALKSGIVLFILDRRLTKSSGSAGVGRIIGRILTNSKAADVDSTLISTAQFQRQCEKMGHIKLDTFFQQWVYGAGCPMFLVTQRFNKKKLVVEMLIRQIQAERETVAHDLTPDTFMRDVKEDMNEVYAGLVQPVFTGPMTIRIHEADGTPYEHIVDIKEANTKFEIPYNTKYKRLKRNRRQKERVAAASGLDVTTEAQDDVLLYCLGDVLQSQEEVADWRLTDWSKDEEDRMGQESYEWIRMDADFEWICKMSISMPAYMFVSQLQQDRDVVAQMETLQYMAAHQGHPLISTILTRTVMDRRYFHGIRTMAVAALSKCAKDELDWIGLFHLEKVFQELFCFPDSPMTRPNDFSNRTSFLIQCGVPTAIAKVKDNANQAPMRVKRFFVDKLKFNDNTDNEFSDVHYVATLMSGLAETLTGSGGTRFENEDEEEYVFRKDAINEIDRYRRIDEWISSYQNVYSITALDCLARLVKASVMQPKLRDFLQYTRPGNADLLRLKAIDCLTELGLLKNESIFKYFLFTAATDPSPYIRENVYRIFGKGLAKLAIGDKKQDGAGESVNGLIIEQEGSTEGRQADLARRQTISGALAALKAELGDKETVKQALWAAVSSPIISIDEISNLLDLCSVLFEPKTSLLVTLKYPRYWCTQHVGKGVLKFARAKRVRTSQITPMQWPVPAAIPTLIKPTSSAPPPNPAVPKLPKTSITVKRKQSIAAVNGTAPALQTNGTIVPLPPQPSPSHKSSPSPGPERHILKLKFKGPLPPIPPAKPTPAAPPNGIRPAKLHLGPRGALPSQSRSPSPFPTNKTPTKPLTTTTTNTSSKAMSPPPRPPSAASTTSTMQRQAQRPKSSTPQWLPPNSAPNPTSATNTTTTTTTTTAPSKKRKEAASPMVAAVAPPPAKKKPVLKIRLSGVGAGGGGGSGESAGSPGASR